MKIVRDYIQAHGYHAKDLGYCVQFDKPYILESTQELRSETYWVHDMAEAQQALGFGG